MSVVVIAGSKPNPKFPDILPDYFIGTNGAIAYESCYGPEVVKWGVLSNYVLARDTVACKTAANILKKVV
ncbi:MAG: hypothetical protein WDZ80_03085 [Candidatus Paceibacterota bacterium]